MSRAVLLARRSFASFSRGTTVADIMTRGCRIVKPGDSIQRAAQLMLELDTGFLPVGTGTDPAKDRLVGMITDRDITVRATAQGKSPYDTKVDSVMTKDIKYVYEDEAIEAVEDNMRRLAVRRLPVLTREHKLIGVVSLGDLAQRAGDESLAAKATKDVTDRSSMAHRSTPGSKAMPSGRV